MLPSTVVPDVAALLEELFCSCNRIILLSKAIARQMRGDAYHLWLLIASIVTPPAFTAGEYPIQYLFWGLWIISLPIWRNFSQNFMPHHRDHRERILISPTSNLFPFSPSGADHASESVLFPVLHLPYLLTHPLSACCWAFLGTEGGQSSNVSHLHASQAGHWLSITQCDQNQ